MEISQLAGVLYLKDGQLAFLVLGKNVNAVELVVFAILICLALEKPLNREFLVQQRIHQSLQHGVVSLVTQQTLHRSVKSYVVVHFYRVLYRTYLCILYFMQIYVMFFK